MSSSPPRFRVVTEETPRPRRPRGPGPAVLLVGLYAVLFIGSLFLLRSRVRSSAGARPGEAAGSSSASSPPLSRAALLEASGMSPQSRAQYLRRLSSDCCPCGCDLTLRDCLLSDEACVKSPVIAASLLRELE